MAMTMDMSALSVTRIASDMRVSDWQPLSEHTSGRWKDNAASQSEGKRQELREDSVYVSTCIGDVGRRLAGFRKGHEPGILRGEA